jgi:hypothetical protein
MKKVKINSKLTKYWRIKIKKYNKNPTLKNKIKTKSKEKTQKAKKRDPRCIGLEQGHTSRPTFYYF